MPVAPGSVISFGEILIDLIAPGDHTLETAASLDIRTGGAPANVAAGLAKLGVPSAFCGVVGDDPFGDRLRATLREAGVDTTAVRTEPRQLTSLAMAWKDLRGDGQFRLLPMADAYLSPKDVEKAGIENAEAIVVGSVALASKPSRSAIERSVDLASRSNVPVCFDVNVRPTLWPDRSVLIEACRPVFEVAKVIKLSRDDAASLNLDASEPSVVIDMVLQHGGQVVFLTDGARGAWAGVRNGPIDHAPVVPVEAIDPVGAGDAFMAAAIKRLIDRSWQGFSRDDLRFAAAAGALAATQLGAMQAMPSASHIESFLAQHQSDS